MVDGSPNPTKPVAQDAGQQPRVIPWAHILTASRLVLAIPTAWCITEQYWWWAAVCFTGAAVSDYWDGRVARAQGLQSNFGGLFDHATDAAFVTITLVASAMQGWVTLWLPILVVAAFVQYSLDSKALAGAALRANWLGRTNGIAYFVMVGVCIGFALLMLPKVVALGLSWGLCATTGISMFNRAQYWWRHRASS